MIATRDGFVFARSADRNTNVSVRVGFASSGVLCACGQHRNEKNKQKPKELFHGLPFGGEGARILTLKAVLEQEETEMPIRSRGSSCGSTCIPNMPKCVSECS